MSTFDRHVGRKKVVAVKKYVRDEVAMMQGCGAPREDALFPPGTAGKEASQFFPHLFKAFFETI